MDSPGFHIEELPELKDPVMIAGFDGWGNALGIASAMVVYIVGKLKAGTFARIDPDFFYRYDEDRPTVDIDQGTLRRLRLPGGSFHAAGMDQTQSDLVLLRADEPSLGWKRFTDDFFSLCKALGVQRVITLGAMFDQVLHTDFVISGIAASSAAMARLREKGVLPVNYNGPSAIHGILQAEGEKRGFECISLWGHCPIYLQETTHFGLMARMGDILADLAGFELDTAPLTRQWALLEEKIRQLIEGDAKLREMIDDLRRAKVRGSWENVPRPVSRDGKVIRLKDFLDP